MAVILKRSEKHLPQECMYGCCTELYGRNVKRFRRTLKRADRNRFRRELRNGTL